MTISERHELKKSSTAMQTKIFTAQNGQQVVKFVTPSGVTGYVDITIPLEALEGLQRKLARKLKQSNKQAKQRSKKR